MHCFHVLCPRHSCQTFCQTLFVFQPVVAHQVWNTSIMMDTYMAKVHVEAPLGMDRQVLELPLVGHNGSSNINLGTVTVEVTTTDDLMAV